MAQRKKATRSNKRTSTKKTQRKTRKSASTNRTRTAPSSTQAIAAETTPQPVVVSQKSSGWKWFFGCCIVLVVIIGGLIALGIISAIFSASTSSVLGGDESYSEHVLSDSTTYSTDKVARINITGGIFQASEVGSSLSGNFATADIALDQLDLAISDPNVKAILLRIDSPGGSVTASEELHQKVLNAREAGKEVVAYIHSSGTSGAYYAAVAANQIISHPTSVNGSIGVIVQSYNYEGLLEKIGVRVVTLKSGQFKDILDGSRPATDEEKAIIQGFVDSSYEIFLDRIEENRTNLTRTQIEKLADGRIYTAKQAADNGLIDAIGYEEDALTELATLSNLSNYSVIEYQRNISFWDELGGFPLINALGVDLSFLKNIKQTGNSNGIEVLYL